MGVAIFSFRGVFGRKDGDNDEQSCCSSHCSNALYPHLSRVDAIAAIMLSNGGNAVVAPLVDGLKQVGSYDAIGSVRLKQSQLLNDPEIHLMGRQLILP